MSNRKLHRKNSGDNSFTDRKKDDDESCNKNGNKDTYDSKKSEI